MPKRAGVLLRIANVNPESVDSHSDRVLYGAIGVFIVLTFLYATAGGAAFLDASSGYTHPWWQWLIGTLVATGVVAYDRAVVGRVPVNFDRLDSADARHLLRRPTLGLYLGRLSLALLFALIITEPLMLARYRGEIEARLNEVHNEQIARADEGGAIAAYETRLGRLAAETAADDRAVAALNGRAAQKRREARTLYRQALADSAGDGVSHRAGCPAGGYCDTLVTRSRRLDDQAAALDVQAAGLQTTQRAARTARDAESAQLTRAIADQRLANARAITADAGFGARTAAMWHLVTGDFWGVGVFYAGVALLLIALDCAAVGLKFLSHGNAYERTEARAARRREHEAAITHERHIRDDLVFGDAAARIVAHGIDAAAGDGGLVRAATERARAHLYVAVSGTGPVEAARAAGAADFGAGQHRRTARHTGTRGDRSAPARNVEGYPARTVEAEPTLSVEVART